MYGSSSLLFETVVAYCLRWWTLSFTSCWRLY